MNYAPSKPSSKGKPMPIAATRLDAVQNLDGSVDVLINGRHIDGGDDLPVADLVGMLGSYAKVHGSLLVTTRLLDGRTTTDRVDAEGNISPYYPPEAPAQSRRAAREHADASVLFRALAEQPAGPVVDPTPVWPERKAQTIIAPRTESRVHTVGEVQEFDVEGDIMRDLAAKPATKRGGRRALVPLLAAIGAILAAGIALFMVLPQML